LDDLIKEAFNNALKDTFMEKSNYNQFPVSLFDGIITHATLERRLMPAHYLR
jgi:hypothetical protein